MVRARRGTTRRVTADPTDENTVYVMNLQVWRSVDGGRTFSRVRVPHGDTHIMWVDPKDSKRLINGNDGGATVSFDGGETWSSIYNQPTAQFYHVTTDNQWPYRILRRAAGQLARSRSRAAPTTAPSASATTSPSPAARTRRSRSTRAIPNITYGGCYTGMLTPLRSRARARSATSRSWMPNYDGMAARRRSVSLSVDVSRPDLAARSEHALRRVAVRPQSTNEGASWTQISPDLTVHDPDDARAAPAARFTTT